MSLEDSRYLVKGAFVGTLYDDDEGVIDATDDEDFFEAEDDFLDEVDAVTAVLLMLLPSWCGCWFCCLPLTR